MSRRHRSHSAEFKRQVVAEYHGGETRSRAQFARQMGKDRNNGPKRLDPPEEPRHHQAGDVAPRECRLEFGS